MADRPGVIYIPKSQPQYIQKPSTMDQVSSGMNTLAALLNLTQGGLNIYDRINDGSPAAQLAKAKAEEKKMAQLQGEAIGQLAKSFSTKQADAIPEEAKNIINLQLTEALQDLKTPIGSSMDGTPPIYKGTPEEIAGAETALSQFQSVPTQKTDLMSVLARLSEGMTPEQRGATAPLFKDLLGKKIESDLGTQAKIAESKIQKPPVLNTPEEVNLINQKINTEQISQEKLKNESYLKQLEIVEQGMKNSIEQRKFDPDSTETKVVLAGLDKLNAEKRQIETNIAKTTWEMSNKSPEMVKEAFNRFDKIRQDDSIQNWDKISNQYKVFVDVYNSGVEAKKNGKENWANVDLALTYPYIKMLDPNRVTDAELKSVGKNQDWWSRVRGTWDQVKTGGIAITEDNRDDIRNLVEVIYKANESKVKETVNDYWKLGKAAKLDESFMPDSLKYLTEGQRKPVTPSGSKKSLSDYSLEELIQMRGK